MQKGTLVLRRKQGESIVIQAGEHEIEITLNKINETSIKVGVKADENVVVLRGELINEE